MELISTEREILSDGREYKGWGYYEGGQFVPHGCGKKFFDGYYVQGNFIKGVIDGPGIISHDYYMTTVQFKNNRGNGWGLTMNRGTLTEFGYYENSQLKVNLYQFAEWYVDRLWAAHRGNENMLGVYSDKVSHQLSILLIGYPRTKFNVCMGFRFMPDGSVWVGDTLSFELTGILVHFKPDGKIEAGRFEKGELKSNMGLKHVVQFYAIKMGKKIANLPDAIDNKNYFEAGQTETLNSLGDNTFSLKYFICEVSFDKGAKFHDLGFDSETWTFGEKIITSPHGDLQILDAIFVEQGSLVGLQFEVRGTLRLKDFKDYPGFDDEVEIKTLALMRQPNNAWLWVYAFNEFNEHEVIFCGRDELDGSMAKYVSKMKCIYQ